MILPLEEAKNGNLEVCPVCKTADAIEFYIDEASAAHAQAHFNNQQGSTK